MRGGPRSLKSVVLPLVRSLLSMKYRICGEWKGRKQPQPRRSVTTEDKLHLLLPFLLSRPPSLPPFLLADGGAGKKKELWAPLISPTFLTAFRELGSVASAVAPDRFRVATASLLSEEKGDSPPHLLFLRYTVENVYKVPICLKGNLLYMQIYLITDQKLLCPHILGL